MVAVTLDFCGHIARVTIDNPPVNALGQEVRDGLLKATRSANENETVLAVLLASAGRTFVAGADIRELGKTPEEPYLPDIIAAIENSRIPWVAALQGIALGGGLELAMACHGRIATPGARVGLPEVNLGIIPGSGGTVRLPRLVPMANAIKMVTGGKPIDAERAMGLGLVDRLSSGNLLADAEAFALELSGQSHLLRTLQREPIAHAPINWATEEAQLLKRSRGAAAPLEALAALKDSARLPAPEALARERERFLRLAGSEEAAALRYVFVAERNAGAALKATGADPVNLSRVGVIGGGTMGTGIATALLLAGSEVRLAERNGAAAEAAHSRVAEMLGESVKRGILGSGKAQVALARLSTGDDYSGLTDCPLVIEAVFEDMAVKRDVFAKLDTFMPAAAVLATNTSYLDVNDLAADTKDPSRILGLHFFSPAHVMKLLEIVRGEATGAQALATGAALARLLGKVPVVAGVCDGFIGNRIMAAYRRECEFMLEEGALPQDIDVAMREFGFAMGLYEVQDMSGLDIAWAQRKARASHLDPNERYAHIADRLCEAGRLGRKTGKGWYSYSTGKPLPDMMVQRIIEDESAKAGRIRREFSCQEIIARILRCMQAEGQAILDEGIAESPADIDVVMVLGYGFPRHKGGPMFMAGPDSSA
jgi:3-hydroxyacyl-CoA dehydrogenase